MSYQKNTAGQKFNVLAINSVTGLPITGDAANITAKISIDSAAFASVADTNPTELDATNAAGVYVFDLSQAETNGDVLTIVPSSTTANVQMDMLNIYTSTPVDLATIEETLDDTYANTSTIISTTDAIKVKTDQLVFTIANQVDANSLTGGTSPSAVADAVWDEAASGHNVGGSFGKFIRQMKEGLIVEEATVDDGSATTSSFQTTLPSSVNDYYNDDTLVFISGSLIGQSRIIADYDGGNLRVTFDEPLTSAPADSDEFILLAGHNLTLTQIQSTVWDAVEADHQITGSTGKALSDASATGGDATAANQQEILTRLSNPIVRVHQDEFGLGFLQLFSNADYDDIAHKRKRWLVDVADTNLTGFDTGALVITDTRTQTVQVTITDCTVNDAGTPSLQGVSVGILQANTASLSVGLKYDFKLTMVKSGSNQRFVVDEGRLEMLR